jgi:hypothetical protein
MINPVRIRLSDENIALLEAEMKKTGSDSKDLINARLSESYKTIPCKKLLSSLDVDVLRMERMSTNKCSHEIIRFLGRPLIKRIIFAAKKDTLNGYVLVMAIEMSDLTVVIDNSSNSLARTPRIMEIEELFQAFFSLCLNDKAVFIREHVTNSSDLTPHDALEYIYSQKMEPFNLAEYLSVLSKNKFEVKDFMPKEEG